MQPKSKSKKLQSSKLKQKKEFSFPLEKENFIIIGIGVVVLVVGYFLMSENSVDGFLPTVIAPILLVAGYCVIIPYGILKKSKIAAPAAETTEADTTTASSNVKTS